MSKIKQFLLKNWPMTLGTMIILSIVLYYVIFNGGVQVFHYDMMEQGIRFVQHGYDLIRTSGITFWDWNFFMGANIFSHGFYFLFSPFWLLFAALPDKGMIPYAFLYVNMLKHLLLFLFSCVYFKRIRQSNLSVLAGASIITFSGFALGYYNYSHFTDVLLFVPLILYFVEDFVEYRKYVGLIVTISIISAISPYLMILFSGFIFPYTLFRYIVSQEKFDFKMTLIDGSKFVLIFALALGISAVFMYPSLSILLSSPRIKGSVNFLQTISKNDLFRYITSFLQPIADRNNFNPLVSKFVVPSFGHSGGAAVYSLIISPLIVPHLFYVDKDKKHKIGLLIFYAFYVIFGLFPNLYFLLQGNDDTRWMVSFIFLNAYTVSYLLDRVKSFKKLPTLILTTLVSLLLIGSYFYSRRLGLHNEEIYYSIAKRNVIILGLIIWLYAIALIIKSKYTMILLVTLVVFESYFSLYNIFFNPVSSISMPAEELPSYQLTNDSVIQRIKDIDEGVYRIDVLENYSFNNPMSKDYLGFTFYHSVYNYEIDDFIQNNIASAGGWVVGANSGKWQYKEMFGSKYWFDLTGGSNIPYGYEYLETVQYDKQPVDVYRNNYPVPFMYAMEDTLDFEVWAKLTPLEKMQSLMYQVVRYNDVDVTPRNTSNIEHLSSFGTNYSHKFEQIQSKAIVSTVLPRSEELRILFKLDGQVVREYYSYEPQYSSVYVEESFNEVEFTVTNLYGVPEEEFINEAYIEFPEEYFDQWYESISHDFIKGFEIGTNYFRGNFDSNKEQWMVTSIAYDKGWSVRINGELVEVEKVNGGFIGFKIPSGELRIEAQYFPDALKLGALISLISFVFLFLIKSKRWL